MDTAQVMVRLRMLGTKAALSLVAVMVLVAVLPAQVMVWEHRGVKLKYQPGWRTAVVGDVNKDGFADVITTVVPFGGAPELWMLSGKDGSLLQKRKRPVGNISYEALRPAGDWNGDGIRDYVVNIRDARVSSGGLTIVDVVSGKDGASLFKVQKGFGTEFGGQILSDLDLDGDKKPDLVVVETTAKPLPKIHAWSNKGKPLYTFTGTKSLPIGCFRNTMAIGKVGDVNGDGSDDYLVGSCRPGKGGAGVLISGKTGKILFIAGDQKLGDNLGQSMDGCGDLDADGVPDYVVGGSVPFSTGVVIAFSGKTGKVLWRAENPGFARALSSQGVDLDRDGVPDVVVGEETASTDGFFVLSGRDGSYLMKQNSSTGTGRGNAPVAMPPLPGHPFGLFLVPELGFGTWCYKYGCNPYGRVSLYRGMPAGSALFGQACRGSLAQAPAMGTRDVGRKKIRLHLSRAPAGAVSILVLGASKTRWGPATLPLALDALGFARCKLRVSGDILIPVLTGTRGHDKGYAYVDLSLRLLAKGKHSLHGQWLSLGPGPRLSGGVSEALSWKF